MAYLTRLSPTEEVSSSLNFGMSSIASYELRSNSPQHIILRPTGSLKIQTNSLKHTSIPTLITTKIIRLIGYRWLNS